MIGKSTEQEFEGIRKNGMRRVSCENRLLSLMLNGFSHIEINKDTHDILSLFNIDCGMDEYAKAINAEMSEGYSTLKDAGRLYFHNMAALDSLVMRGLVEREILFLDEDSPEDGWSDLNGRLEGASPQHLSWLARALCSSNSKEKSFQYPFWMIAKDEAPTTYELGKVSYLLTTKGYDVALKLQEHSDQEKRFIEQQTLTQQSVKIAASSRKIARTAVCVAVFIAAGSIGNLTLNFWSSVSDNKEHLVTNNDLNVQTAELTHRGADTLKQGIEVELTPVEKTVGASQTKAVSAEIIESN